MNQTIKLRLEVETIKPDTPEKISELIKQAVNESFSESVLANSAEKPVVSYEQNLPSTEQLSLLVSTIQLVVSADPLFFSRVKSFLHLLFANYKFKKAAPAKISATLSIGDKRIEVKNCSVEDSIKLITKEYEVIMKPRHKE